MKYLLFIGLGILLCALTVVGCGKKEEATSIDTGAAVVELPDGRTFDRASTYVSGTCIVCGEEGENLLPKGQDPDGNPIYLHDTEECKDRWANEVGEQYNWGINVNKAQENMQRGTVNIKAN